MVGIADAGAWLLVLFDWLLNLHEILSHVTRVGGIGYGWGTGLFGFKAGRQFGEREQGPFGNLRFRIQGVASATTASLWSV